MWVALRSFTFTALEKRKSACTAGAAAAAAVSARRGGAAAGARLPFFRKKVEAGDTPGGRVDRGFTDKSREGGRKTNAHVLNVADVGRHGNVAAERYTYDSKHCSCSYSTHNLRSFYFPQVTTPSLPGAMSNVAVPPNARRATAGFVLARALSGAEARISISGAKAATSSTKTEGVPPARTDGEWCIEPLDSEMRRPPFFPALSPTAALSYMQCYSLHSSSTSTRKLGSFMRNASSLPRSRHSRRAAETIHNHDSISDSNISGTRRFKTNGSCKGHAASAVASKHVTSSSTPMFCRHPFLQAALYPRITQLPQQDLPRSQQEPAFLRMHRGRHEFHRQQQQHQLPIVHLQHPQKSDNWLEYMSQQQSRHLKQQFHTRQQEQIHSFGSQQHRFFSKDQGTKENVGQQTQVTEQQNDSWTLQSDAQQLTQKPSEEDAQEEAKSSSVTAQRTLMQPLTCFDEGTLVGAIE